MPALPAPYGLLAELTYRCPLHCPYCANPTAVRDAGSPNLSTAEWSRVFAEAAAIGVHHVGLSGGEPLLRPDLTALIAAARASGLYTNLITSGIGLTRDRALSLKEAGLDSMQISIQSDEAEAADFIAGARTHEAKLAAIGISNAIGFPLTLNVVLHRLNIDRLEAIVRFAASLHATRLELASAQYVGWAFRNRAALLPTREQVARAEKAVPSLKAEFPGIRIAYVPPDYYGTRPKPCLHGWGSRLIAVQPGGRVLPCPTADCIPGLVFDNVRERSLAWIWEQSPAFQAFRGTKWMPDPCRSCPEREIDHGGCRCQAALLTADPTATDPACALSPHRATLESALGAEPSAAFEYRKQPTQST